MALCYGTPRNNYFQSLPSSRRPSLRQPTSNGFLAALVKKCMIMSFCICNQRVPDYLSHCGLLLLGLTF